MQESRKHHALSDRQVNHKREVSQPLPEPEIGSEGNQIQGCNSQGTVQISNRIWEEPVQDQEPTSPE